MGSQVKFIVFLFIVSLVGLVPLQAKEKSGLENLKPALLFGIPPQAYQSLGPVGADGKDREAARKQLRREAIKLDADAVMKVICEKSGIYRDGMSWSHHRAYCKGTAIKYKG